MNGLGVSPRARRSCFCSSWKKNPANEVDVTRDTEWLGSPIPAAHGALQTGGIVQIRTHTRVGRGPDEREHQERDQLHAPNRVPASGERESGRQTQTYPVGPSKWAAARSQARGSRSGCREAPCRLRGLAIRLTRTPSPMRVHAQRVRFRGIPAWEIRRPTSLCGGLRIPLSWR
jgi:hypothetical protein